LFRILATLLISSTLFAKLNVPTTIPYVYLVDLDSGKVLYEKNSNELIYPASTTKIATALYILSKEIELDTIITCGSGNRKTLARISPKKKVANHFTDAPYLLEYDGVFFGLKYGEEFSLRDLLFALMLSSGNDVANVLAEYISGDIETFCKELNDYMKEIGATRTHFMNPHGLHHPEHVSTPRDMVLLGKKALEHPFLQTVVSTAMYSIGETNKHGPRDITQGNKLLKKGSFYYPKAIGVKTGNHLRAGKCLVGAAKTEKRALLGSFFKAKDWNELYGDTIALMDAAFREKIIKRYLFRGGEASFFYTLNKEKIRADLLEDIQMEYYPSEEPNLSTALVWNALTLPIREKEVIGYIRVYDDDTLIREVPLHAHREYKKKNSPLFWGILIILACSAIYPIVKRLQAYQTR